MSEIKDLPKWKPGLGSCPDIPDYQLEIDRQDATIAFNKSELIEKQKYILELERTLAALKEELRVMTESRDAWAETWKVADKERAALKEENERLKGGRDMRKAAAIVSIDWQTLLDSLETMVRINDGCHFTEFDVTRLNKVAIAIKEK